MKKNRFSVLSAAILAAVVLCPGAQAVTFLTEQFVYSGSGNLGSAANVGGTGAVPGWNSPQPQITFTNGTHSLDGTGLGLVSSAGDKVLISGTNIIAAAFGCYNKFVNSGAFPTTTNINLYYSFLYRFNVGTDVPAGGVPIIEVNRENSGFATGVGWQLIAQQSGGNIQLGICKALGPVTNYAPVNITAGQTFLVVVRQQIISGAANDIDDLWINPPPGTFGTNEANVPPVNATTSNGTEDTSNTGPGRFWVAGSGANANLDELRIASTWAEATPPVGIVAISAAVSADPTNVTQCAEIGASFTVTAVGTSPTYQWQIRPSGSGTFTNIPGATSATYTTPNLALATDNSNGYRAIVTVSCDNSTATSGVATVTLTAPVVTPPGVVMDDFFTDMLRDNTPVTPSNSVWYTSGNSSDLDATTQTLIGIPVSGSSSLWIGNFVDESVTNLPVHLAVGTAIKVTLPFTPTSYGSFTNNASLRFGLFDYADGDGMVTNDTFTGAGSGGNGIGVRGYMLSLNFGPTFTVNSPLSLLARNALTDISLMGSTGDFLSLDSGPSGGGYTGASAFIAGTEYTLVFTVARTDVNAVNFTTAITGGGTNWTFSSTETNLAYHRFDAFAIRPNSLETSANSFDFPEFKVEVTQSSIARFNITSIQFVSPTAVALTWASVSGINYQVQSTPTLSPASWTTNATVMATGITTSYTNSPVTGSSHFYRVVATQ